ncbi:MAG: histidine kinase N-terminal 7TM domain-containing protein [Vulcanimicrobiota bacterium]
MSMYYWLYISALIQTTITALVLAIFGWSRRKSVPGALHFSLLMCAIALWSAAASVEAASTDIQTKILWSKLEYIGAAPAPVFLLLFSLHYACEEKRLSLIKTLMLWAIPATILISAFTNDSHYLFWNDFTPSTGSDPILRYGHGPLFLLAYALISIVIVISIAVLIRASRRQSGLHRDQTRIIIIGTFLPFISTSLYVSGWKAIQGVDISPLFFLPASLLIAWGMFRYKLFDLVPVARHVLIERMSDGVIVIDRLHRIADMNPEARNMLSAHREILGTQIESLFPPWSILIERLGDSPEVQMEFPCGDNKNERWLDIKLLTLEDSGKLIKGLLMMMRDVTERHQSEEVLRKAKEETEAANRELTEAIIQLKVMAKKAEAANRAKSYFLANMSHEIRTPMNGIVGMADLLLDTELSLPQRGYAEIIKSSSDTLLVIINDILDFSRIEAGKINIENTDFDIRAAIEETADLIALKAQQKGLELICVIKPEVPQYLRGDPNRLRQVFTNLAYNAVKFTHKGEISIEADILSTSDSEVTLRCTFRDTGIGIPAEKMDMLFKPFTQLEYSASAGTGLGLSISKKLIEMMGGQISVTSNEGSGSTFQFTACFQKLQQKKGIDRPSIDFTGRHIIIIDDNCTSLEALKLLTASWGFSTVTHRNCEEAIETLSEWTGQNLACDAIILDALQEKEKNTAFLSMIKKEPLHARVPVILLVPLAEIAEMHTLVTSGFSACLTKPVKAEHLKSDLAAVCGMVPKGDIKSAREIGIREITGRAGHSSHNVKILAADDNSTSRMVLHSILTKLGYRADMVINGCEVLKALESTHYDLLLLDCQMPEMDGYETARQIRDADSPVFNPHLPIIALTAHAIKGERERCLEAGMSDYLSKPVQLHHLKDTIERWISLEERSGNERHAAPYIDNAHPVFDYYSLLQRFGDARDSMQLVCQSFLGDMAVQLEHLRNALIEKDMETARRSIHTIKGSAAQICGMALSDASFNTEKLIINGDLDAATNTLPQLARHYEDLKDLMNRHLSAS